MTTARATARRARPAGGARPAGAALPDAMPVGGVARLPAEAPDAGEAAVPASLPASDSGPAGAGSVAPVRDLVGFQLRRAHTLFALHWQSVFREEKHHVTPMQGGMLLAIESNPGLTQAALARLMDVEGPTLLQSVDRLEGNGLIRRVRRADDRRAYALQLTPAGEEALLAVKRFVPLRESELLVDLSAEERATLLDLLQRVVRRGQDVLAQFAPPPARPAPRSRNPQPIPEEQDQRP
ncbi:MarR family winged helix-turn-helix transcriptional regulator [Roseomonas sp. BN140053]|uniref:MarR family winged helix-turn-helix transcriptional regulator n=1 Tax=Roseomonas sp. BN140053 TaxID=3391898 RepID=UPI0039ED5778